jgi:hypothetical protein
MSCVRCSFCSTVNPTDVKYCNSCWGQLNLAPCPHCDGVNEVTALICHACESQLVEASVEEASFAEQPGSDPARGASDRENQTASRETVSGRLLGSGRETGVGTAHGAAIHHESNGGSISCAATDLPPAHSARAAPYSTGPDEYRGEPAEHRVGSAPVLTLTERRVLGAHPVACSAKAQSVASPPKNGEPAVEPQGAEAANNAVEPLTEAHGLPKRDPMRFRQPRVVVPVAAGFILALGILVYGLSRGPVHSPSPFLDVPSREGATTTGDALGTAVARGSDSATACTEGAVALGLCSSEAVQAQAATQIRSSDDVTREAGKEAVTTGCIAAAAALGLCTQ